MSSLFTGDEGSRGVVRSSRAALPEQLVALGVMALGVFTLVDARRINVPVSANAVGPRVVPYAVGGVLILAGAAVLVSVLRGSRAEPEAGEDIDPSAPTDWVTIAKVVIGFALHVLVVDTIGWALAGALLFTVVAWALGGHLAKAAGIGVVLGFVVQAAFVSGLGVTLPVGPFGGVGVLGG
jgi:putative tricarboxylic transport membrane protein